MLINVILTLTDDGRKALGTNTKLLEFDVPDDNQVVTMEMIYDKFPKSLIADYTFQTSFKNVDNGQVLRLFDAHNERHIVQVVGTYDNYSKNITVRDIFTNEVWYMRPDGIEQTHRKLKANLGFATTEEIDEYKKKADADISFNKLLKNDLGIDINEYAHIYDRIIRPEWLDAKTINDIHILLENAMREAFKAKTDFSDNF